MTEPGKSASDPKSRSAATKLLPAAFALLLIGALSLLWLMRKPPVQAATPTPTAPLAATPPPLPQPVAPAVAAAQAPASTKPVPAGEEGDHRDVKPYPVENVPPKEPPPNLTPAQIAEKVKESEEWLKKNKKPDLTSEEKVERAAKAMKNFALVTDDLEKQIKDAEQDGRKEEAAEKKIRLQRLRSRLDAISKAVEEKRDPSGGVDELAR